MHKQPVVADRLSLHKKFTTQKSQAYCLAFLYSEFKQKSINDLLVARIHVLFRQCKVGVGDQF